MRFRRLVLKNFGGYYTEHVFRFDVEENKNVILIGGKNGAGKTTILDAIRLALYGSYAYGYRSESDGYQKKVYSHLNKRALLNGEGLYQIFLEFDYVEDLQKSTYTFKRQWYPLGTQIKEEFSVIKDGLFIQNPVETDIVQTKINQVFPLRLFELCLFDGETISKIISEDLISKYLKEISYALFNIELFTNLNKDIETYKKQLMGRHDAELFNRYEQIGSSIEKDLNRKAELEDQINQLRKMTISRQEEINELNRQFMLHGGLMRDEREKTLNEIYAMEQERKELNEKIKAFINNVLPLFIVRRELEAVNRQMELEQRYMAYEQLVSVMTPSHMDEILIKLNLKSSGQGLGDKLLQMVLDLMKPEGVAPIHRASFSQRNEVQSALNAVKQVKPEEISNWFTRSNELLVRIQEFRKKLDVSDSTIEFQEIANRIQALTEELGAANLQIANLQSEVEALEKQLLEKQKQKEQLEQKLTAFAKVQTTLKNIEKIIKVSQEFIKLELEDKIEQVQIHALAMLQQLLRKEGFIERIEISPTTFEVNLYSKFNSVLDKRILSAGEKQVLLLSIIWAIIKVSGKRIPFVFDSLLGRLDQIHKRNVLTKFIPNCGEQVIILATDSEIDQYHLKLVLPYVASVGTLENDPTSQSVKFEHNQYFNFKVI